MRRSKSYEVRDPMNIWNKYDFAMSGLGKKSKILAKIKHFFKCVKWSKQRITRGYCDCDVWEMFSFLQTLIPDMLQTLKDTRTGSPGYLGENYTNENGILVNDTCHEEWNCILDKMIFLWREAEKDTCSQKNPFDEAHSKAMDEFTERFGLFGNKLQTEKELEENRKRGGGGTIHFMDELPEYKEISDKYREEEKRLEEYRRKCKDEAIDSILIKMAQLNRRKTVLDVMRKRLPKSREEQRSYMSRNSVPEYRYINYDLELVKNEYELVSKSIMEMQMALDKYNQTVQFEVDI